VATNEAANLEIQALSVVELLGGLKSSTSEEASIYSLEIIRRFEPLLRQSWTRLRDLVDYEDFVQDVFVQLFRHLANIQTPDAFPGYFQKVASSVVADHLRKKQFSLQLSESSIDSLTVDVYEDLLTGLVTQSYLDRLTPQERDILTLDIFCGYSQVEIAGFLMLKPAAVRASKHRALKKLRKMIRHDLTSSYSI
jgi:RNA polymerase sigma factor (sigma-70 family)